MLTEAEKKWLEGRKGFSQREFNSYYFCTYCEKFTPDRLCHSALCPIDVAHVVPRDAAEFEARVAKRVLLLPPCAGLGECVEPNIRLSCGGCRLKHARLAVEAEMG